MNRVVVLMATYNGEKYLKEQVDSLLNQKNVKVSILVRDDGSTDNTQKILEEYQKKKLLKWYTGEHLYVAKSFLDLISKAPVADYYAFCDQDDVWDEDKIEIAIKYLNKSNKIPSLYYCGQKIVDEDLNFIKVHNVNTKGNEYSRFCINTMAGCTAVFNYELFLKIKEKEPESITMHDNWTYKVCASLGGKIYIDKKPHIQYRQHSKNVEGLNNGILGKIRRGYKIVINKGMKKNIEELYRLYGNEMTKDYKELCDMIINYNKSINKWFTLLTNKKIDFNDIGLSITFKLKVLFFQF